MAVSSFADFQPGSAPQQGGSASASAGQTVTIAVTRAMARDYKLRGVFPSLHVTRAPRGGTTRHSVTQDFAAAVLADAREQCSYKGLAPGLKHVYRCAVENIHNTLSGAGHEAATEPVRPASTERPGYLHALERMGRQETPATLKIGASVLAFWPGEEYGQEAVIAGPYGTYRVVVPDGAFARADGSRFDYLDGYMLYSDGESIFAYAHQITTLDCRPTHLALVPAPRGGLQ